VVCTASWAGTGTSLRTVAAFKWYLARRGVCVCARVHDCSHPCSLVLVGAVVLVVQVSLLHLAEITEEGVRFQSPMDGSEMLLTPEMSMALQNQVGSVRWVTLLFAAFLLGDCSPSHHSPSPCPPLSRLCRVTLELSDAECIPQSVPSLPCSSVQIGSDIMMALDDVVDSKTVDAARRVFV
jgi:hypothetical protein